MHLADLRAIKGMVSAIVRKKIPHGNNIDIEGMCSHYETYIRYKLRGFARAPRTLKDFVYFKASEFRQFGLHGGIVLLKQYLPENQYVHFLKFSLAYRIVSSEIFGRSLGVAQTLFEQFVLEYKYFYPEGGLGYNVHNLIQVVSDVKMYGTVDSYSAYKFENAIQLLGNVIRKPSHVLQQIFNRIHENQMTGITSTFRHFNNVTIRSGEICLLKDMKTYVKIESSPISSMYTVRKYSETSDFFTNPIKSSDMYIVRVSNDASNKLLSQPYVINSNSIQCQCHKLPFLTDFVLLLLM